MRQLFFLIFIFHLLFTANVFSQNEIIVKKSEIVENINGTDYYLHFVKEGQTLFNIAKAYGVTVNDIFTHNPDSQSGIKPGQILKIPYIKKKEKPVITDKPENNFFYHIIKKKETLYGISRKYGVEIDEIRNLNPELGEYPKEGQTLKIPVKKKDQTQQPFEWEGKTLTHFIKKGETLYGIAKKYNVTIGEIRNANPGLSDMLEVGEIIIIPNQNNESGTTAGKPDKTKEKSYTEHIVKPEETLYRIAKNYAVSIDLIKKYNPGLTKDIKTGQVINIPKIKPEENYIIHKTDKNDKLQKIAKKYDVSYEKVVSLNPDLSKKVAKGQTIKIPVEIPEEILSDNIQKELPIPAEVGYPCGNTELNNKNLYNVALMIPLFLEELDSLDISDEADLPDQSKFSSFQFIQFYEGFLMAVDSLKKAGMNLNLFIYDVDNSPAKIEKALRSSELSSMDLIIGPFYGKSFEKAAAFAKTYKIKIVNPLSTREEIVFDNSYVFKVKPATNSQTDQLVSLLTAKYPESNVVIVRNNYYKYQATVSFIRNYLNSKRKLRIYIPNKKILDVFASKETEGNLYTENMIIDNSVISNNPADSTYFSNTVKEVIYVNDSVAGLQANLSRIRNNIVIAISEDNAFSQEVLSKLNKLSEDHNITLFGIPEWGKYDDLETEQLLNLNFHCFTSTLINYQDISVKNWIADYRVRYKTEPSVNKYAYDGFDIAWYFLNALFYLGKDFENCLDIYTIRLMQTRYIFDHNDPGGFQNLYWNIYKYRDYKKIPVNN